MSLEFQNYGIEQPLMLLLTVPVFLLLFLYLRRPRMTGRRWLMLLSRTLCVFLIAFALATPYMFETKEKYQDTAAVTILSDRSGSMDLFGRDDAQTAENIYQAIRKQVKNNTGFDSTSLKEYSKDSNQTVTGDVLYQNSVEFSKQSNLVILYTDGETNYGRNPQDVADILSKTGTKILTVHPVSPKQEIYIAGITGDKKVPLNSEYPFTVDVGKVGADAVYDLNVYVDQKEVHTGEVTQTADLTHINMSVKFMDKEGPHVLSAAIIPKSSDHFEVNNKYSKIIDVVEKPSILVITSEPNSPLTDILSKNYDVSTATRTPNDISSYATVYLDNQNASTISDQDIGVLHKYVEDGNGLVVVGGSKSYDSGGYSARPNFESLLPVRSVKEPEKKRKEIAIVLVIDASGSMGDDQSKTQHEKDTAISIIRQLDLKDHVGVVAFNGEAFDVSEMGVLNDHIADIEDKIPRIIFSQGTNVYNGLDRADQMLQSEQANPYAKYVILLSDGESASSDIENSMAKIKSMKDNGITTFTVGVGYDTETIWMQQYADLGGGEFLDSEQFQNLKMYFQQKDDSKDKAEYKLLIKNKNHFITSGLALTDGGVQTALKDYNDVSEKSVAQVLVWTEGKNPIVTVWKFGVGRVVCLTTDNGIHWANNLYTTQNGRIVSAITNWAIGDLEKKKQLKIESTDIVSGAEEDLTVKSSTAPTLTVRQGLEGTGRDVSLKQIDVGMYAGRFTPDETGIYYLKATAGSLTDEDAVAVNYPDEYGTLGTNEPALIRMAAAAGEEMYNSSQISEIEDEALKFMKEGSMKKIINKTPLQIYFAIAAVSLFFLDTVIRRINEIRRLSTR